MLIHKLFFVLFECLYKAGKYIAHMYFIIQLKQGNILSTCVLLKHMVLIFNTKKCLNNIYQFFILDKAQPSNVQFSFFSDLS